MSGCVEVGRCQVCGKDNIPVLRQYYNYDIQCECHSPTHFEIVWHCKDCQPKPPREIKVVFKGEDYIHKSEEDKIEEMQRRKSIIPEGYEWP